MTKPFLKMLHVSLPGNGKSQTYTLTPESQTKFDFSLAEAVFAGKNGNLEISVEGEGTVILENYQELVAEGEIPPFVLIDGEEVAGDVYLFAFGVQDQTDGDLETAAGNTGGGSGAGEYSDDAGTLGDGLSSLSGQNDTYSSEHFVTLSGTIGNHLPIANDDTAAISEAGDSDFSLERSIVFVEDEAAYQEILASDEEAVGEYFSLAQGGGFYISNPNPPQIDDVVEGNVIDNDADSDGDKVSMESIRYVGDNHDGEKGLVTNDGVVDNTVVLGKYGVLVIDSDGHYEYTLNQEWADGLNEGETFDEVFQYTIVDAVGGESNVATLTVTITGANDMPVAHDDLNVQAVEVGDSEGYDLHASVYDADLAGSGGTVDVHDSEEYDYTQSDNVSVSGNLLAGDDAGGVTDTDVDSGDSPDGETMFVVGVYSEYSEILDYVLPTEQNTDFVASDGQTYDAAVADSDSSVSVSGEFGVLTIQADGSYEYVLYTEEDGEAYAALNALNYDSEDNVDQFTYAIIDDSGAFSYANISFTVNGANDAPVAYADVNAVNEYGLKGIEGENYSATVEGNVILGDDSVGVDTDVDDSVMYVATIESQTGESDTLYTDESMDSDAIVTIDGEYGTLAIHADGSYEYTLQNEWASVQGLNEEDHPEDVFTYTLTNAYADDVFSEPTTLTITVNGSNDAPVAVADANAFTESVDDEPQVEVSGNLLSGDEFGNGLDTDVDNSLDEFSVTGVESNNTDNEATDGGDYNYMIEGQFGTLFLNADGDYTYVENQDATEYLNDDDSVTDTFTYTMTDNQDGTDAQSESTLTITISGADDAPVTDPSLALSGTEDTTLVITESDILAYVSDVDTSADGLEVTSITIDGVTLSGNSTDGWTYTPEHNVNGELSISYTVSDGTTTVTGSGTLTLAEAEEPPVAINDVYEGINITTAPEVNEITSFSTFDEKGSVTVNNITLTAVSYEPADGALEFSAGWDDSVRFESLHNNEDLGVNNDWWGISKDNSDNIDSKGQQDGVTITFTDGGKETVTIDLGSWDDDDSLLLYINGSTYTSSYTVVDSFLTITASDYDVSAITSITLLADDAYGDSYFNISAISAYSGEDVQVLDLGSDAANAAYLIDGNVLANDLDLEGDTLIVTDVDGTSVSGDDTIIYGDYGVLTIDSDGHYEYQLYEDGDSNIPDGGTIWTDLTGDVTETFHYTVAESDDTSASDVGTLEIPIHVGANVVTDTTLNAVGHHFMEGSDSDDIIYLDSSAHYVELDDGEDTVIVDDDYITDSTRDVTIYSFDDDDGLVLNDLMGETVTFGQNSDHDLTLTIVDHDGSETNDVVITLDNYNLGDLDLSGAEQALVYNHTVEISSSHESLDSLVQSIIDSPDSN